jgi:AraC-like DNA-binding protein
VWESFVVLAVILLFFGTYTLDSHGHVFKYITQLNVIILVGFLLWRVETLSELANIPIEVVDRKSLSVGKDEGVHSQPIPYKIGPLLQKHCIDTQLYLQHDLTAVQLARAIGTNRFYLSQYFSHQGITYNAYINNLRIEHFKNLYHKNVAAQKSFTAQQLSQECGFHSYRTFSNAFKQQMGQTVTAWMKTESEVS